jgi:hypothetical protein
MNKLDGLTKVDCAIGCDAKSCVIAAGRAHCMHPCKGGVPYNFKNDPVIHKIYADACTALGVKNKNLLES